MAVGGRLPPREATKLKFGRLAIGTMTFGAQTPSQQAFEILDAAIESDEPVLVDTAEMYPVYPSEETHGESERIIGNFIRSRRCRDRMVVATKIASCNPQGIGATELNWIRSGGPTLRYDKKNITLAVEESLHRLQLDYVDLVQLHWPERPVPMGDALDVEVSQEESWTPFEEVLETLQGLVTAGLVRCIGISNETPWGLSKYLNICRNSGGPAISFCQNQYNLLNRSVDLGLNEVAVREACPLLAYAPLAGGRLTGKYLGNARPDGSRYTLWPGPQGRYHNHAVDEAVKRYMAIADRHDMSLIELALGFVLSRSYCAAVIYGAKTLSQYHEVRVLPQAGLNPDILSDIEAVHKSYPNPSVVGAMADTNVA